MKRITIQPILPHILAIIIFIVIGFAYFPDLFEGKVLNQSDVSSWQGASEEINQFRKTAGEEPLWTGSMFSGMPTNMISISYPGNYTSFFAKVLNIFVLPVGWLIVAMIGFYLLLLCFKVNPWLAIVGSLAFAFCSYNFEIIQVGHATKMNAISLMPWVLAGFVYAYRYKPLAGALFVGIALSLEIQARHPQITYYLGFIILSYVIAEAIIAYRNKLFPLFIKTSLYILVGVLLGIGSNVNNLWPTSEYSKYTMRGGSELTHDKNVNSTGLTKEYATAWSYSIEETPNLLIPNFNGGASGGALSEKSATYRALEESGTANAKQMIRQMPTYWGPQSFTAGPMYMGAISVFLFVLGLSLIKGPLKWCLASVSLLAVFLSWGQHFIFFYSIFYDYLPLFDKFRVPSMILIILQLTLPLLGFYTVNQLLNNHYEKKTVIRSLKISLFITGGFCLLFALLPSLAGSFTSPADHQYPQWLLQTLPTDRESLLRSDAFRSFIFILLTSGILWLGYLKKIKFSYAVIGLGLLVLADLWTINKRYLNSEHFVSKREYKQQFTARPVDREILKDRDPNYRVLDLTVNTFNDSHISYYHKTIGGYSAAKLQRYQDIIDYHLFPEIKDIIHELNNNNFPDHIDSLLTQQHVLNMLNARYVIITPAGSPLRNKAALGNAWFVRNYNIVKSADEEILALQSIDPSNTAIINETFSLNLEQQKFLPDSNATIHLLSYAPNKLEYKYSATTPQLAVFSEVYYPVGWKAYINGKETPHFRANYILRSMIVPAGDHTITFKYAPESYYRGAWISRISSGILLLLLAGIIIFSFVKRSKEA